MNVKRNLKKATSKQSLKDVLFGAVFGTLLYTIPATLFKMSGPGAMVFSGGLTWLVGAATGQKGIQVAGLAFPAIHGMYVYGNNVVYQTLKTPIWKYDNAQDVQPLSDVVNMKGERIAAATPTDMPSATYDEGMNDYMERDDTALAGYIDRQGTGLNGYVSREGSGLGNMSIGHEGPSAMDFAF